MTSKIDRLVILTLLLVFPTIQSPEGLLQDSETITNYAVIVQPATDIFFEYGAESGVLQPPWDWNGGRPSGTVVDSYVAVDTAHVRSGTKSMKIYQPPPTKTDGDRRVVSRVYNTKNEYYTSWWMYVDDTWDETNFPSNCWTCLGGWMTIFTESTGKSHDEWGRWYYHWAGRYIYFSYDWWHSAGSSSWPDADATSQIFTTSYDLRDYKGYWVHFQHYIKFTQDNTGVLRAWFSCPDVELGSTLIADKTGIITDPRGYSDWSEQGCSFVITDKPWWNHNLYSPKTAPEQTIWIDDVVLSDTKVPETYRVYT